MSPPHVQSLASPASMSPMLCQPFAAEAAKELATLYKVLLISQVTVVNFFIVVTTCFGELQINI